MPEHIGSPLTSPALLDLSMLSFFDDWVREDEATPAQTFEGLTHSYGDLARSAKAFADALQKQGVGSGDKVAVSVPRSESLLPLLLAIWSLRAAYIPIDPTYPSARQSYILQNVDATLLICDAPPKDLAFAGRIATLAFLQSEPSADQAIALAPSNYSPDDTAYIIYTSGSTGDPKGVVINHGNLINFLLAMRETPGFVKSDRMLAVTTISFDIHILELFVPLLVGAQVVIASKDESVSQAELQKLIDQYAITAMQATPATWRMLLGHGWLPGQPLKILVGGEALPKDLQPLMFAAASELWNMYGPTETTVWSLCHRIQSATETIYIGRPIRQTSVFIVNEQLHPLPAGTPGELLIGGAGVAAGYYAKPELTERRFLNVPECGGARVYRTGDRVVERENGLIEYLDRVDNQLKVRGFRIEPLEVERVLEAADGIKQAAVVASEFADNDKRLMAFYLGTPKDAQTLRNVCKNSLPAHLVPQHFLHLDQFPMTPNNKIDRKQLAAIGTERVTQQASTPTVAARDDLDRSLIAVWERALGVKGIGLDDNFFNLGGHSLLALQVAYEMNQATGMNFSATALFEAPTLRALRDSAGEQANVAASVVRLNNKAKGEPVFCLCGVQIYQRLANQFAAERPVYGVFARDEIGFIEAKQRAGQLEYSFDKLVRSYMDAIQRQGKPSKLALVGLSFGGLIALEAAKRFRAEGVEVTSVVLLDTYLSSCTYRSSSKLLADMRGLVRRDGLVGLWLSLLFRSRKKVQEGPTSGLANTARAQAVRETAFDHAALVYEKDRRQYDFDVLLIKARYMDFGFGKRAKYDYGLSALIEGELTIETVDADHIGLVRGEAVADVHKIIAAYEARHR